MKAIMLATAMALLSATSALSAGTNTIAHLSCTILGDIGAEVNDGNYKKFADNTLQKIGSKHNFTLTSVDNGDHAWRERFTWTLKSSTDGWLVSGDEGAEWELPRFNEDNNNVSIGDANTSFTANHVWKNSWVATLTQHISYEDEINVFVAFYKCTKR